MVNFFACNKNITKPHLIFESVHFSNDLLDLPDTYIWKVKRSLKSGDGKGKLN